MRMSTTEYRYYLLTWKATASNKGAGRKRKGIIRYWTFSGAFYGIKMGWLLAKIWLKTLIFFLLGLPNTQDGEFTAVVFFILQNVWHGRHSV